MQTGLSAAALGVTSTMRGYGRSVGIVRGRDKRPRRVVGSPVSSLSHFAGSARGSLARDARVARRAAVM